MERLPVPPDQRTKATREVGGCRNKKLASAVSAPLGFGERTVEVSRDTYMLLRGRVVLELSADNLRSLPDVGDEIDEKRAE